MKALLLSTFLLTSNLLFAIDTKELSNPINNTNVQTKKQRSINSIKDYKELESLLKSTINYGRTADALPLASLYMQTYNFKDGSSVKANFNKANEYLQIALSAGYGFASYNLAKFYDNNQALIILEDGFYKRYTSIKIRAFLAIRYIEIILNDASLYNNTQLIKIAIKKISPIFEESNNLNLGFELAHLYFINKEYKIADSLINYSCNNKRTSPQLLEICMNDSNLNKGGAYATKDDTTINKKACTDSIYTSACAKGVNGNN